MTQPTLLVSRRPLGAVSERVLVELCAGTASVSLWAIGRAAPLTGFMGSKRRWAPLLVDALGCDRPDRVVLVDAGPWGDVWTVLRDPAHRAAVTDILASWAGVSIASLLGTPSTDPARRVAQFLALQWRSATAMPVWFEDGQWRSGAGSGRYCAVTGQNNNVADVAVRLRALDRLPWDRIEVVHGDVRSVDPIPGSTVLFDPPYIGAPRYACLFPRADVLATARRWQAAGARVAVCEAVPLDDLVADGWHAARLPGVRRGQPQPREWITSCWPITLSRQETLWR